MNSISKKAYFTAVLYALIIGFSFLFVKVALTYADPLTVLAHRFTISLGAAAIPIFFGRLKLQVIGKDMVKILPLSIFYPTLFFALQTFGLVYLPSAEAGVIQSMVPIFTLILATLFLKEESSTLQKGALILSVIGVVFIFFMKGLNYSRGSFLGILLILLSTLSMAGYNVMARGMTKEYSLMDLTFMMNLMGCISFNIIALIFHSVQGTLLGYFAPFKGVGFRWALLYLGVCSSLLSSYLSNYTLAHLNASKMSVFSNLATLITMLAGVIFLKEALHWYHGVGAIMILLGILGTNFLGNKEISMEEEEN